MVETSTTSQGERQAMMQSMMSQMFGGMDVAEKKEIFVAMMGKMTEGLDMKEMMTTMLADKMSAGGGGDPGKMHDMMAKMMHGGDHQPSQMPEMMLTSMMPRCIGMMLPAIEPDKRREAVSAILSAIVDKGTEGMSAEKASAFRRSLSEVLNS